MDSVFVRNRIRRTPSDDALQPPFAERMLSDLEELAAVARQSSGAVSAHVFSILRGIDDILRPLLSQIALHPVSVEREIAIESLITDYVPTSLRLFFALPPSERAEDGVAHGLLNEQVAALERSAENLSRSINADSLSALRTQSLFIQSKFSR
jgi:hypothetical protein